MRLTPSLLVSAALMGILLAHGCSTVSSSVMVPDTVRIEKALGGTIRIEAAGSPKRAFVGKPLVTGEALSSAVRDAIMAAGLFDETVDSGISDRILTVTIERLDEPEIGLDQTCEVAMRWRLLTGDRSRTLWEELITTKTTINTYEERDTEMRAVRAIEGALKSNVRRGLERMSHAG